VLNGRCRGHEIPNTSRDAHLRNAKPVQREPWETQETGIAIAGLVKIGWQPASARTKVCAIALEHPMMQAAQIIRHALCGPQINQQPDDLRTPNNPHPIVSVQSEGHHPENKESEMPKSFPICAVPGCGKRAAARGICTGCAYHVRLNGDKTERGRLIAQHRLPTMPCHWKKGKNPCDRAERPAAAPAKDVRPMISPPSSPAIVQVRPDELARILGLSYFLVGDRHALANPATGRVAEILEDGRVREAVLCLQ
jgi:hypothetical protein